jgi:hypothetical protein
MALGARGQLEIAKIQITSQIKWAGIHLGSTLMIVSELV